MSFNILCFFFSEKGWRSKSWLFWKAQNCPPVCHCHDIGCTAGQQSHGHDNVGKWLAPVIVSPLNSFKRTALNSKCGLRFLSVNQTMHKKEWVYACHAWCTKPGPARRWIETPEPCANVSRNHMTSIPWRDKEVMEVIQFSSKGCNAKKKRCDSWPTHP